MSLSDRLLAVQDHNNLVKDGASNAVLNDDYDGFQAFKSKKERETLIDNKLADLDEKMEMIFQALVTLQAK